MKKWYEQTDVILGIAVIGVVAMLVIPIPSILLDMLLGISIMLSLVILLTAMYNTRSSDFSVFPSLLLITTVYRLSLNVSSTRLILLKGPAFDGQLIRSFGEFVVGGNYIIGFIIFLILIFVQMMVITKGATRISEVAARFTLDALPGKQMSIDSDLSAGIITEEEARRERDVLRSEVDFYGQMDGATKFVQGDVRVGLIITAINIIGGLIVGVVFHGLGIMDALRTYTLLTIGDGLVAQIPSLLITTATGMVVTRASSDKNIATDISNQLFDNPKILYLVAGSLFFASIIPGFPKIPLWLVSGFLGFLAYNIQKRSSTLKDAAKTAESEMGTSSTDRFLDELAIEPLKLEIGYNLIPLVKKEQGDGLLEKITMLRQKLARDKGIIVPPIRIHDNMDLDGNEYAMLVGGIEVGKAKVYPEKIAALDRGKVTEHMEGESYQEPTFQVNAILIPMESKKEAEDKGYLVVDANNIMITHISEILKNYATQIMGREEIKLLLDKTKEKYPSVVEEVTKNMSSGLILQVFHNLIKENVSIRNVVMILEVLADHCERVKNSSILTEHVRKKLALQIINQYQEDGIIKGVQIDPMIQSQLATHLQLSDTEGVVSSLDPQSQLVIRDALLEAYQEIQRENLFPVFITSSETRLGILMILERELSTRNFVVISYDEIPQHIKMEFVTQAIFKEVEEAMEL